MRREVIFASLGAMLLSAACGGDDGGETGPVKIALLAPETGALEFVGLSFHDVANVAVENINDNGGVDGRALELTTADTETDPATAAARLQELIDSGVVAVVGPATSGEVTSAFPVAASNEVPIISPSSTAPSLSGTDAIASQQNSYRSPILGDGRVGYSATRSARPTGRTFLIRSGRFPSMP